MALPVSRPEPPPAENRQASPSGTPPLAEASEHPVTAAALQLEHFSQSLREPQNLALVLRLLGPLQGAKCLFLSCGMPSGALSFHLQAVGGNWTWTTLSPECCGGFREFVGDPLRVLNPQQLPFQNDQFHRIVITDPDPFLLEDARFSRELGRVLMPRGRFVAMAANRRPTLAIRLLQRTLGLGHGGAQDGSGTPTPRPSSSFRELERLAWAAGLFPDTRGACSRFFSECVEEFRLRGGRAKRVGALGRAFAALDYLVPTDRGATIAVAARKPEFIKPD